MVCLTVSKSLKRPENRVKVVNVPRKGYKEGKYAYSILGLPDEYYCKTHYDEMMDIVDMMETDVGSGKYSKHSCEVSGCSREGTNSIIGFSGSTEYYCTKHYNEMNDILSSLFY